MSKNILVFFYFSVNVLVFCFAVEHAVIASIIKTFS